MENESDTIILNETQKENIKTWINHGWEITVDLVKLDGNGEPTAGFCSGFLFERTGKLYVVSAGHGLGNRLPTDTECAIRTLTRQILSNPMEQPSLQVLFEQC